MNRAQQHGPIQEKSRIVLNLQASQLVNDDVAVGKASGTGGSSLLVKDMRK